MVSPSPTSLVPPTGGPGEAMILVAIAGLVLVLLIIGRLLAGRQRGPGNPSDWG